MIRVVQTLDLEDNPEGISSDGITAMDIFREGTRLVMILFSL